MNMDDQVYRRLARDHLSQSWLAARLGLQPVQVDLMRRAGELIGTRPSGLQEHLYPAWQFDPEGKPLGAIRRVVSAAREAGIDDERLIQMLNMRIGLGGQERLLDAVREGREEYVLGVIKSARSG